MRCTRCRLAALYQQPGFMAKEKAWCTVRGEWRKRCGKGKRGRPMRAVPDIYVTIDGWAAVNGEQIEQ